MSGRSSGVTFELRRKISKWANAWLALRYIGLGCFIIILSLIYLTKQDSFFITKCDNFITKCDDYYKMRQNISKLNFVRS